MFGGGGEDSTLPFGAGRKVCPRCQCAMRDSAACQVCNWPGALPAKNGLPKALLQVRRQAMVFARIGLISEAERQELVAALGAGSPLIKEHPASSTTAVAEEPATDVTWLEA